MLDRVDPGLDRDVEPAAAERMAHHPPVERVPSSTNARISSRLKAGSSGPCPGLELAPPVVAHLITSAPARTILRTTCRTSSIPLQDALRQ